VSKFDTSTTPLGRVGKPEDMVGAVVFFASDDSDFISGQTLIIDGGRRVI
jgi:3-oxoacyl-[acyl-carrier protein] reductase